MLVSLCCLKNPLLGTCKLAATVSVYSKERGDVKQNFGRFCIF